MGDAAGNGLGEVGDVSAFMRATGLVIDDATGTRVTGHMDLGSEHHTPHGIVHGGVYAAAVESAASIGASLAVRDRHEQAVGLTNTTHFLRAMTAGSVRVEAVALHQGRTQQLWQVDILDARDRLVARGEVRVQNLPGGRVPGGTSRADPPAA